MLVQHSNQGGCHSRDWDAVAWPKWSQTSQQLRGRGQLQAAVAALMPPQSRWTQTVRQSVGVTQERSSTRGGRGCRRHRRTFNQSQPAPQTQVTLTHPSDHPNRELLESNWIKIRFTKKQMKKNTCSAELIGSTVHSLQEPFSTDMRVLFQWN